MSFKVKDYYFKGENYLRSIYKLEEINTKFKVIKQSDSILDLGYHPGSWAQYSSRVGSRLLGIDIKPVNQKLQSVKNINLYESDAFNIQSIEDLGVSEKFDVVLEHGTKYRLKMWTNGEA